MLFVNLYTGWWRTASWKRGTLPLHRGRRSGPLTAAKLTTLPPSEKFAIRYVQAQVHLPGEFRSFPVEAVDIVVTSVVSSLNTVLIYS